MTQHDRQKWNEKYQQGSHSSAEASSVLEAVRTFLPATGRALDVGGGAGRNALWLARQGLDVTLADISSVALQLAERRSAETKIPLRRLEIDLDEQPFPEGPWDVILAFHYLARNLLPKYVEHLAPRGLLIMVQPTLRNLERHAKPGAEYLLKEGEMPRLVGPLKVIHYEEGWLVEGRHEALIVARADDLLDRSRHVFD